MKPLILAIIVLLLLPQDGWSGTLPKIVEAYSPSASIPARKLSEVIPPSNIKSITMLIRNSKGSPVSKDFRPDYDSDELFARLFREDPVLESTGGLSANEGPLAQYVVVLTDYTTCFVEVLYDSLLRRGISRILIRGNGFGGSVRLRSPHE